MPRFLLVALALFILAGCSKPPNFFAHPTPEMEASLKVKQADLRKVVNNSSGICLVGLLEGRYWVIAPGCQKEPWLRTGCLVDGQSGEQFTFSFNSSAEYIPFNGANGFVDPKTMFRTPARCLDI